MADPAGFVEYRDPSKKGNLKKGNPELVEALNPSTSVPLSPKDQRALNLEIAKEVGAAQRVAADPLGSISEGERKAATLLTRIRLARAQIKEILRKNPDAVKPEMIPTFLEGINETGANMWRSTPRQQIETAQMDILDAALTLGTGAAYTKEQLEGYRRSYFPQLGDNPPVVKDKEARLDNIVKAAELAAGRAAKLVPKQDNDVAVAKEWLKINQNDPLAEEVRKIIQELELK